MRDKVKINNVELTRAQIEQALAELNAPEDLQPGDIVRNGCSGVTGVVANAVVNKELDKVYPFRDKIRVISEDTTYTPKGNGDWIKVGSLLDFKEGLAR